MSLRLKATVSGLLALAVMMFASMPADAQLIVISRDYRVVAIDASHNQIQVAAVDSDKAAGKILVGPDTRLYVFNHEVPTFAWHMLQRGMKITVKGGYTWDFKMKARQIFII